MQNSIWKYLQKDSFIHRLNSTFKLISLILMLISSCFINSYKDVTMLFSYLILTLVNSGINIRIFLKEISTFKYFAFFIILIDIIIFSTLEVLLVDVFKLIFIVTYLLLFVHTSTVNETMYAIGRILDPLGVKKDDSIILYAALLFRFFFIYHEEFIKLNKAYKERNNSINTSMIKRIKDYKNIKIKAFNLTVYKLNKIAVDMKIKLFGYGKSRTNYRLNKFGVKEALLVILNMAILIVVIIY